MTPKEQGKEGRLRDQVAALGSDDEVVETFSPVRPAFDDQAQSPQPSVQLGSPTGGYHSSFFRQTRSEPQSRFGRFGHSVVGDSTRTVATTSNNATEANAEIPAHHLTLQQDAARRESTWVRFNGPTPCQKTIGTPRRRNDTLPAKFCQIQCKQPRHHQELASQAIYTVDYISMVAQERQ